MSAGCRQHTGISHLDKDLSSFILQLNGVQARPNQPINDFGSHDTEHYDDDRFTNKKNKINHLGSEFDALTQMSLFYANIDTIACRS